MASRYLQLTLAIIKPHVVRVPHVLQDVRNTILLKGFYVLRSERLLLSALQAETFYAEHRERFFYNRLVTFMCSGPVDVHILARQDAIQAWRSIVGPTKVYQAQYLHPKTLRGSHGLSDTRNAAHGSDSPQSAAREMQIFYPEFDVSTWYRDEAEYFCNGTVEFHSQEFIHRVMTTNPN